MAANRSLEDGMAILRFIAESDAIKQVRGRIRDGASRVADNDRVPRVIAGSAGILAALLSDTEEPDTDAFPDDLPSYEDSSEMEMPSADIDLEGDDDADEDQEPVAAVRDLDGTASLDAPLEEEEHDDSEDEAGVLLPYDAYEASKHEDLMAEDGPQPHAGGTKQAKGQVKAETKSADRPKKKGPAGKKTPTVKATKSANAAKGAARKAAVKRKKPAGKETVSSQAMDTSKPGRSKSADKSTDKSPKSKAAKAAKATKAIKPAQGKPASKPAKPRVVKRPAEKSSTKGDPTVGKKSS